MRKLLLTLLLALWVAPCYGQATLFGNIAAASGTTANTFTFVQRTYMACSANPCSITVGSTGSGHLLVMTATNDTGGVTPVYITSVSGGGTWVIPAGCQSLQNLAGSVSCAYVLASSSGTTSVSVGFTTGTQFSLAFWEYSFSAGSTTLDQLGAGNDISASPLSGITLTGLGTNDVIIQWIVLGSTAAGPTAVSGLYGHLLNNVGSSTGLNYSGYADLENTSSGAAPSWTVAIPQVSAAAAISFR